MLVCLVILWAVLDVSLHNYVSHCAEQRNCSLRKVSSPMGTLGRGPVLRNVYEKKNMAFKLFLRKVF